MTAMLTKYNSNKELYFKISKDLGNIKKRRGRKIEKIIKFKIKVKNYIIKVYLKKNSIIRSN